MDRLMIVADNAVVIQAVRLALRQTAGFQVLGFIDGRTSVGAALEQLHPDVVLIDDMRRPADALARIREVAALAPQAKALLLTANTDPAWYDEAFDAGAHAVLAKSVHPVTLGTLLREVARGTVVHRPHTRSGPAPGAGEALTDRELEILRLVAEGHTNGRIAEQLWVTQQTVKFHLSNTYRKLGVANRTQASRYAYLHDLVAPQERLAS